jgi:hypothetical protein
VKGLGIVTFGKIHEILSKRGLDSEQSIGVGVSRRDFCATVSDIPALRIYSLAYDVVDVSTLRYMDFENGRTVYVVVHDGLLPGELTLPGEETP